MGLKDELLRLRNWGQPAQQAPLEERPAIDDYQKMGDPLIKPKGLPVQNIDQRPTIATPGRYGSALQRRRGMMARRNAAAQLGGEYKRPPTPGHYTYAGGKKWQDRFGDFLSRYGLSDENIAKKAGEATKVVGGLADTAKDKLYNWWKGDKKSKKGGNV